MDTIKTRKVIPIKHILEKLAVSHGDVVAMQVDTYKGINDKAIFIDKEYGEWKSNVRTVINGTKHPARAYKESKLSIEEVKTRIFKKHGNVVKIIENTYISVGLHAKFIDKDFGEWETEVKSVCKGRGHPERGRIKRICTIEEIKVRIFKLYGDTISIVASTYKNTQSVSTFIDKDFGEFKAVVNNVLKKNANHRKRIEYNSIEKWGVPNPIMNKDVKLKAMRASVMLYTRFHWKTNEELYCQASWEAKVVDYLNKNQIDFLWQPSFFTLPNGKRYYPDLFLVKENKWIEIKGYMRPDSKLKWDWFLTQFPTAELWNEPILKQMGIL